jgi:hypothetical protein
MKGNFDRVSTMIVGMFDVKEQYHVEVSAPRSVGYEGSTNIFDRVLY